MNTKIDIKNLTLKELEEAMGQINELPYRAVQIFFWLYRKGITNFNEMNNVSQPLIDKLDQNYCISHLTACKNRKSSDGTEKFLFELQDSHFIETVLIRAKHRRTLCLSTQAGCKFACSFCASGLNGFIRDLSVSEIVNQVLHFRQHLEGKITNYVFMGMGEPLDNYENVSKAIKIMNNPKGMAIGARRITISTCGIIPGIERLRDLGLQINLSISLHASNDELRSSIMPVNKQYPLGKLIKACEDFRGNMGRMITIEYILIRGVNDSTQDVMELVQIAKKLQAKVNLILYSRVDGPNFKPSHLKDVGVFMKQLIGRGVSVTLRESKGKDIQAACGQLAGCGPQK